MSKAKNKNWNRTENVPILPRRALSSIERVDLERIFRTPSAFVDHVKFHKPYHYSHLFPSSFHIDTSDVEKSWNETMHGDNLIQQDNKRMLSSTETRTLFLQYNYARSIVFHLREKVKLSVLDARRLLHWQSVADTARNTICVMNLRLVVGVARQKGYCSRPDYVNSLFPAGQAGLLLSAYYFDISLGWAFSTYACRTIYTKFIEALEQNAEWYHRSKDPEAGRFLSLDAPDHEFEPLDIQRFKEVQQEEIKSHMLETLTKIMSELQLPSRFKAVLRHRLGISVQAKKLNRQLSLEEIGKIYKVSRERIRQMEAKTISRIKTVIAENRKMQLV